MKSKGKLLLLFLVMNITVTTLLTLLYPSLSESDRFQEGYLFTFAHITDSQFSESSAIFEKATSWLVQQNKLSFVIHTGDIVNGPLDETAWKNAYQYMHQLDGRTRWAVLTGDDDGFYGTRPQSANYEKYFGNNSQDQYVIVEDKILFILLNWNSVDGSVSKERLEWMDEIIQSHKGLRVVIGIHPFLFGFPILNLLMVPNADEIWHHIDKHENVLMTLSGHIHQSWVRILVNGKNKVWSIATEALMQNGYIRLFDVYEDKIEVYAYSPWANKMYTGTLDRFTIKLNPDNYDVDVDLWNDESDVMPTHPFVPNGILGSMIITISILIYWIKNRKATEPSPI